MIPIKSYCPSSPTNSYQMQVYLLLTGIWTEPSTCCAVQSPSDCSLGTKHSTAPGGNTHPAFLLQPSTRSYPSITPKGKPYPSCLGAVPLPLSDCLKQDKDFGSSQPRLWPEGAATDTTATGLAWSLLPTETEMQKEKRTD